MSFHLFSCRKWSLQMSAEFMELNSLPLQRIQVLHAFANAMQWIR